MDVIYRFLVNILIIIYLWKETETDTDTEILARDAAIARAELEAASLQREIQETEQAELTDTGQISL